VDPQTSSMITIGTCVVIFWLLSPFLLKAEYLANPGMLDLFCQWPGPSTFFHISGIRSRQTDGSHYICNNFGNGASLCYRWCSVSAGRAYHYCVSYGYHRHCGGDNGAFLAAAGTQGLGLVGSYSSHRRCRYPRGQPQSWKIRFRDASQSLFCKLCLFHSLLYRLRAYLPSPDRQPAVYSPPASSHVERACRRINSHGGFKHVFSA